MFDFFRKLFAPERSSETAKERLRLVLLSDHLSLAPETIEALKRDLLDVISRYVDIDAGAADVTFEQRDHEVAMLASIPITGVRDRQSQHASTTAKPLAEQAASAEAVADPSAAVESLPETPAVAKPSAAATEPAVAEQAAIRKHEVPEAELDVSPDRSVSIGEHASTTGDTAQSTGDFATAPARSGNAARPRRRRRKKGAATAAAAKHAAPAPAAPETGNKA